MHSCPYVAWLVLQKWTTAQRFFAASQTLRLLIDTMQEPAYYDARTRDWDSEKESPNALPNAQQHESTTTPSHQNHYDGVDGKGLDRTLTADSHVHHKVR